MILISYSKHTGMLGIKETFFNTDNESLFLTQPGCIILIALDAARNETIIHNLGFGLKDNEGYVVEDSLMRPLTCPTE